MLITAQKEHEEVLLKQSDYRRDAVKVYAGKEFFDPDNTEAVAIRKYVFLYVYFIEVHCDKYQFDSSI